MQVPFARPSLARATRAPPSPRRSRSGWVSQGPRVARVRGRVRRARRRAPTPCAATNCTTALHLALYVVGRRPRRRGHRAVVVVHRHRQRRLAVRRDAGLRRRRPAHLQPRPGRRPSARSPSARRRSCRSTRSACRPTWTPSWRSAERHGARARRGRRVRDRRAATRAARSARSGPLACFSLHPRKVITTGEGGMIAVHDPAVAARLRTLRQHAMDVSDLARHGAQGRRLRGLSRARLELPHDRHAGGARAAASSRRSTRSSPSARRQADALQRRRSSASRTSSRPTSPTYATRTWQSYAVRVGAGRAGRPHRADAPAAARRHRRRAAA